MAAALHLASPLRFQCEQATRDLEPLGIPRERVRRRETTRWPKASARAQQKQDQEEVLPVEQVLHLEQNKRDAQELGKVQETYVEVQCSARLGFWSRLSVQTSG